jgi:hypothetical protein
MINIDENISDLVIQLGHLLCFEHPSPNATIWLKNEAEREQTSLPQEINGFRLRSKP